MSKSDVLIKDPAINKINSSIQENKELIIQKDGELKRLVNKCIEFEDKYKETKNSLDLQLKIQKSRLLSVNFDSSLSDPLKFEEQRRMLENYFDLLVSFVDQAKNTIVVLDFIDHGKEMGKTHPLRSFLEDGYKRYFNELEKAVLDPDKNVEYIRILQIPTSSKENLSLGGEDSEFRMKNLKYALDSIYMLTQSHLDNLAGKKKFKLFVIDTPMRQISEAVIDSEVWITEIDKYNKFAVALPDKLFIHRSIESSEAKKAIDDEVKSIENILRSKKEISHIEFQQATYELYEEKDQKSKKFKDAYKHNIRVKEDFT